MIINGGSRSNSAFFARHLVNAEHNERVTLIEIRNLAASNIPGALREMEAVAMGTFCKNYFYHANINPREDEQLTPEQWMIAVNTLELHLALSGNARFIVEHQKHGRTHRHVVWSRIDVALMRAVVMTDNYAKHETAAREAEKLFGLTAVSGVAGRARASGPRPTRRPKAWESFRGQQTGIDPHAMKERLTHLYRQCSNAVEFAGKLSEQGMRLVTGHRAEFCVVDQAGHLHSLARRLDGVTAAALRLFMRDIASSLAALPG